MPEEQSDYDSAKKTQLTLQLTDDTLEIARFAYETFQNSHPKQPFQSLDEFIDDMVFFGVLGVDKIVSSMERNEQETASE